MYVVLSILNGGTGYTKQTGVPTTGGSGSGLTVYVDVVNGSGTITTLQTTVTPSSYRIGDVVTVVQGTNTTATAQIVGYDYQSYTYSQQYTPYTYLNCMSPGDNLIFLNGTNFAYGDGNNNHTSLYLASKVGSASAPYTIMAYPGATATLGGTGTVNFGGQRSAELFCERVWA
jgi:hypothetical protein